MGWLSCVRSWVAASLANLAPIKEIMHMKNFLIALALALSFTVPVAAQTTVTQTTIAAAMTATQPSVTLTSATGVTAGGFLYVDQELMQITSLSGTVAQVLRGQGGTGASAHGILVPIFFGPSASVTSQGPFYAYDPPVGTCTASAQPYSLHINVQGGRIWTCANSTWQVIRDPYPGALNYYGSAGVIAAAATIAPTQYFNFVTGTTAIVTITPPNGCTIVCEIVLIPFDASTFTTTAAGNIALATTAVRFQALRLVYNSSQSKWYPSY